ncbi:DUF948 domain-containing protein [Bacillaceae bacterium Marseille-Q3522]|nr:DUF948 domain-containing protein [Bacillaceae bacterium Marseille-Q3522]
MEVKTLVNLLYASAFIVAVGFFILVIYLVKTLKSLEGTLDHVSNTLKSLEKQLDGVTRETTDLLHKTNALAADIQKKSDKLNSVVDAVKDVGSTVQQFNGSIKSMAGAMNQQVEHNQEKIAQILQWADVILQIKNKWQSKKEKKYVYGE